MSNDRLRLYRLDPLYVQELSRHDRNVLSTLPEEGKANRPFVGVVIVREDKSYCVPISSPKPKHEHMKADRDFSKIVDKDGKLIGVLNFNNMIPVDDRVLILLVTLTMMDLGNVLTSPRSIDDTAMSFFLQGRTRAIHGTLL